jgi:hypothetical protein
MYIISCINVITRKTIDCIAVVVVFINRKV